MTQAAYFVLTIGFVLLLIEFFLPNAIIGITGAVLLVLSIVFYGFGGHSLWAFFIYLVLIAVLLTLFIILTYWRLKKEKIQLFSDTKRAPEAKPSLVDEEGEVIEDLTPSGYVEVLGRQYRAVAQTGHLLKGQKILVVEEAENHLVVKASGS